MFLYKLENVLLFLTIFFLPTQLGRHFWPNFSFVYSLPIDYLSPVIYFWDLLVALLLTVFLLQKKTINKGALNLFLLFILTQLISLVPATQSFDGLSLGSGLVRLEQYLIAGLFGVYLASINLVKVKEVIFWSLSLAVVGESILAIIQFFKGSTLGLWILGERTFSLTTPGIAKFDFQGIELLRPYATFSHPNILAAFMVIILPLLNLFKPAGSVVKFFSIIIGMTTTILTVSRASLVAGLAEALLLLNRKILAWLILLGILLSPFLYTRFSATFNFDNLTLLRREALVGVSWDIFRSHPFLGIGLNNFIPYASDKLLVGPNRFLQPVHNIFLLSLSETGIVGLLGFLLLLIIPVLRLFKLKTLLLIWASVIFLGLFDHYFLTLPQGYRLLFLIWGISLSGFAK